MKANLCERIDNYPISYYPKPMTAKSTLEPRLANWLRYGIYFTALLPLIIFSDFLSPFHFGKVILFRAWMEILLVGYIALILTDRRWLPRRDAIFWALTTFTIVFGLSTLTSANFYQSLMGTLERMGGWFSFLHFWFWYVIATAVLTKREHWLRLVKTTVIVSFLSTLYAWGQKIPACAPGQGGWCGSSEWFIGGGGRARIFGTIGNTALFAGYELVNIFLAVYLATRQGTSSGWRWLYLSGAGVSSVAVFSTAVRGSLIAWVVGMALLTWFYIRQRGFARLAKWLAVILLGLVLAEGFLVLNHNAIWVQNSGYLSRLSDISPQTRTVKTRLWAWQAGIDGWNDSVRTILVGYGPENFNLPFSKHFNPQFYQGTGSETLFDRAHNMFVEVLVTMGALGLLAYLAIFGVLARALWQVYQRRGVADDPIGAAVLLSGLAAYIIHNLFIFDTSANFIAFFVLVGLVSFLHRLTDGEATPVLAPHGGARRSALVTTLMVVLIGVVTLILIFQTALQPVKANYATTRGVVASWAGDHAQAVAKFKEAMAYETFGEYEIRHRFAQYLFENLSAHPSQARVELMLYLIEEEKKSIPPKDNDYLPYLYISRAYIVLGKDDPGSSYNDLALQASAHALAIAPTFVRTYYEIGQAYLNKRDYVKAEENFQKALDLNPAVGLSWWYLAVTQLDSGRTAEGISSILRAIDSGYNAFREQDLLRLSNIFSSQKPVDYERLVWLYEKLVRLQPLPGGVTDKEQAERIAGYYARLATAYFLVNRLDEAVLSARAAVRYDPGFRSEAEAFVRSFGRTL